MKFFSRTVLNLDDMLLADTPDRVQLHPSNVSVLADQFVESVSAHNSIEDRIGHHRLILSITRDMLKDIHPPSQDIE